MDIDVIFLEEYQGESFKQDGEYWFCKGQLSDGSYIYET